MANVPRQISFIAAAVSCRRTFVGPLIKGTGAIPVERPQDVARKGKGKIVKLRGNTIIGVETNFSTIS
jgi:glycerol-3-phosphate O-acyltransferase/dihydroxyacetone phosphate acyltransferase